MIEQHMPGTLTFTVTAAALAQFRVGEFIDCSVDGKRVAGTVIKAELGSAIGLVVVKLPAKPDV